MALIQKRSSKRQYLIYGVLAAAVVIGLVMYFVWIAPPSGTTTANNEQVVQQRDLPLYQDFGEELFSDPRYRALRPYGELPVQEGNRGRDNPFSIP